MHDLLHDEEGRTIESALGGWANEKLTSWEPFGKFTRAAKKSQIFSAK